jgi:hypothetical protein
MPKYLCIQRSTTDRKREKPSPTQMQEMYAAFNAWKDKFKANIADMGGQLKSSGGKVVSTSGISDGPFVEAKEIVGGFMIVVADSYDEAVEVASGCPGLIAPGSSCEIRELSGP